MSLIRVKACLDCPFAEEVDGVIGPMWTCRAMHGKTSDGSIPRSPPRWCPLRTAAVTLALDSGPRGAHDWDGDACVHCSLKRKKLGAVFLYKVKSKWVSYRPPCTEVKK